ncbi:hypothetical protein SERLA73DRAFT_47456, partial [Serpula lacrymans var. lacrymans S7.3]
VRQMTSREHHNIQHTIVPTIIGAAPPNFVRAIRAMINFIYAAQYPIQTARLINAMVCSLQEFHQYKDAVLDAEARSRV